MTLKFGELDDQVRSFMETELTDDIPESRILLSDRLSAEGRERWTFLLNDAITDHDDLWLAQQIITENLLNDEEPYKKSKSGFRKINKEAASKMLAESEFNKYYIRAICLKAIKNNQVVVRIFRAKEVNSPRPESNKLLNQTVNPSTLLEVVRGKTTHELFWAILEPNSGLSVTTEL